MNKKIIITLFSLLVGLSVFVTSCIETSGETPDGNGGNPAAPNFELTLDGSASDTNFTFEGGIINNKEDTEIEEKKVVLKVTDKNAGSGTTPTPVYKFLPTTPFTTDVEDDAEVASVKAVGIEHVMAATATLTTASNIPYPTENGLLYSNVQLTCNGYNAEAGISAANLRINCTNAGDTLLESTVFSDETKQTVARNAVTQSAATFKIVRFPSAARHNEINALITENIAALETISDLVTYVNGLEQTYAAYSDVVTSEVTVTATSTLSFTPDETPAAPNFELTLDSASDTSFTFEGGVINNKEDTEIEEKKVVLKVTDKNAGSSATQTPVYRFLPTTEFTTDVEDDVANVLVAAALPHITDITATLITAANIPYPVENGLPNNSNVQLACSINNVLSGITAENIKIDCVNFGSTLLDSATFSDETKKTVARNAVTQSAATFKIVRFPSAARHIEINALITENIVALETISDLVAYVNGLEQTYAAYSDVVTSEVTVTATSTLSFTPDETPAAPNFELTLDSASDTSFTFEGGVINNKEDTEIEGKKVVLKVTDKNPGSDATQTPVYRFLPTTEFTTEETDEGTRAAVPRHITDITATIITASNIPYPAGNDLVNNSNVQLACSINNPPSGITAENIKIDCVNFGSTLLDSATFSDETKKTVARNAVTQSAATFKIVRFPSAARHNEISALITVKIAARRTISDLVAYVNGLEQAYAAYSDVDTSEVTVTATSTLSFTPGGTK